MCTVRSFTPAWDDLRTSRQRPNSRLLRSVKGSCGRVERALAAARFASATSQFESTKPCDLQGFAEAADGTRTHDLLHGKQKLRSPARDGDRPARRRFLGAPAGNAGVRRLGPISADRKPVASEVAARARVAQVATRTRHGSTTGSFASNTRPLAVRLSRTAATSRRGIGIVTPQLPPTSLNCGRLTVLPERVMSCSR